MYVWSVVVTEVGEGADADLQEVIIDAVDIGLDAMSIVQVIERAYTWVFRLRSGRLRRQRVNRLVHPAPRPFVRLVSAAPRPSFRRCRRRCVRFGFVNV